MVRPDGYIALIAQEEKDISNYLQKLYDGLISRSLNILHTDFHFEFFVAGIH